MPSAVTIRVCNRVVIAKRHGNRFTEDKFVLKTWKSVLRRRMHKVGCRRTDMKVKFADDPVTQYIPEYGTRIPQTPTVYKPLNAADTSGTTHEQICRLRHGPRGGIIQSVTIDCPPDCWLCAKRAFLYID